MFRKLCSRSTTSLGPTVLPTVSPQDQELELLRALNFAEQHFGNHLRKLSQLMPHNPFLVIAHLTPGTFCALWSFPRPELVMADWACSRQAIPNTVLTVEADRDEIAYALENTESRTLMIEQALLPRLSDVFNSHHIPSLRVIVVIDAPTPEDLPPASSFPASCIVLPWSALLKPPQEVVAPVPRQPDDIYTVIFTSGSTGSPKGAVLTDRAFNHRTTGPVTASMPNPCVHISFAPLGHALERHMVAMVAMAGGQIGFARREREFLFEDLQSLGPTMLAQSPRFYLHIHQAFRGLLAARRSELEAALTEWRRQGMPPGGGGGGAGEEATYMGSKATSETRSGLPGMDEAASQDWTEELITQLATAQAESDIRPVLGPRIQALSVATAPTSDEVLAWIRRCWPQAIVTFPYGTTEVGSVTEHSYGALPGAQLRLEDVPELGYHTTDTPWPRGELQVRTATIASGYYRDPEATGPPAFIGSTATFATSLSDIPSPRGFARTATITIMFHRPTTHPHVTLSAANFTADGFFRTGDIVELVEGRRYKYIDRKKNCIKLSQGEFVALEKLEVAYQHSEWVGQICLYAQSTMDCVLAVVVPDQAHLLQALPSLAPDLAKEPPDRQYELLCAHPDLPRLILEDCARIARAKGFRPFEVPAGVVISKEVRTGRGLISLLCPLVRPFCAASQPFTAESGGLLTASLKPRRAAIATRFQTQLAALLGSNSQVTPAGSPTAPPELSALLALLDLPVPLRGVTPQTNVGSLGLDSLGLMRVVSRMKEHLGLTELPFSAAQLALMSFGELAATLDRLRGTPSTTEAASMPPGLSRLLSLLRQDWSRLDEADLRPGLVRRHIGRRPWIVLTGATGFLGPLVLERLLAATVKGALGKDGSCGLPGPLATAPETVPVMVTQNTKGNALVTLRERDMLCICSDAVMFVVGIPTSGGLNHPVLRTPVSLCAARRHFHLTHTATIELFVLGFQPVRCLAGDLEQHHWGLSAADWALLASRLAAVVHVGAHVNHMLSYESLRAPNVEGTLTAIELALAVQPSAALVYVSTMGIFGRQIPAESTPPFFTNRPEDALQNMGYAQSKGVGEHLVEVAQARWGLRTLVIRPPMIGPDSRTGFCNVPDVFIRMVRGCLALGCSFAEDDALYELVPGDFAALAVVEGLKCLMMAAAPTTGTGVQQKQQQQQEKQVQQERQQQREEVEQQPRQDLPLSEFSLPAHHGPPAADAAEATDEAVATTRKRARQAGGDEGPESPALPAGSRVHLHNPHCAPWSALMAQLAASSGRPLPQLPKATWLGRCREACARDEAHPLYPLLASLAASTAGSGGDVSFSWGAPAPGPECWVNLRQLMGDERMAACPPVAAPAYWRRLVEYLTDEDLMPPGPQPAGGAAHEEAGAAEKGRQATEEEVRGGAEAASLGGIGTAEVK
ncbi:putative peroxisome Long-Chain Acyl-CoA Synthetase [Paratrimastix pyriformis]|uniref:Peroxisome Long-Chain Acyl-CoA Synthetase n=1 Tax=Paratrimastix pyriformis TaxID=342808 RepID=A0ABQ8UK03_9EUKA|nr:putative peroxisome Long-Chain Acyl-CoA Synthetase [Paratrimastix pyriformis]